MNLSKNLKTDLQVVRYSMVGTFNTAIDFGLLFGLNAIGFPVELANTISTGTAFVVSFFMNKKYAFKTTDTNVAREVVLFIVVTLFGLWVLQNTVINLTTPLSIHIFHDKHLALLASKLLATGVSLVWNYILYNKLVFVKH